MFIKRGTGRVIPETDQERDDRELAELTEKNPPAKQEHEGQWTAPEGPEDDKPSR
jgi:hypothetical protein